MEGLRDILNCIKELFWNMKVDISMALLPDMERSITIMDFSIMKESLLREFLTVRERCIHQKVKMHYLEREPGDKENLWENRK